MSPESPSFAVERFTYYGNELSPYQLVAETVPFLANRLGVSGVSKLLEAISPPDGTVLDIGASNWVSMGTAFFDAKRTICVDPAYKHYESPKNTGYGAASEKEVMVGRLRKAFSKVSVPTRIQGSEVHTIEGTRAKRQRTIDLVPQEIANWLHNPDSAPFQHIIAWRAFLPDELWGEIIARLPIGGVLMTTGYGEVKPTGYRSPPEKISYASASEVVNRSDIVDTPLPRNGHTPDIGLTPLTKFPNIYFYEKSKQLGKDEIVEGLRKNSDHEIKATGMKKFFRALGVK